MITIRGADYFAPLTYLRRKGKMKTLKVLALSAAIASVFFACGKAEQQPAKAVQSTEVVKPVGKTTVEVPDIVKGKWKAVVIAVEDKEQKDSKEYTVALGEKFTVPGSTMDVEVKDFFPSFVMEGATITSSSNTADNPAARVIVTDGGSEVFSGWLFAKYPTTHAFSHPKYAITLKSGIPN